MTRRLPHAEQALLVVDLQDRLVRGLTDAAARQQVVDRCTLTCLLARKVEVPVLVTELHPRLQGRTIPALAGLPTISRRRVSAASEPAVVEHLTALRRPGLVVVGIETHVAVAQSALDLAHAGFQVRVLVDAVTSRHTLDHDIALRRMERAGIELSTVDAQLHEWVDDTRAPLFQELVRQLR